MQKMDDGTPATEETSRLIASNKVEGRYAPTEEADWADPAYGRRIFDYYGIGLGGPI